MQFPFSSQSAPEWTSTSARWNNWVDKPLQILKKKQKMKKTSILQQDLTTKSLPRQSTSAGTPLWGLQVFLGYRTSLRRERERIERDRRLISQFYDLLLCIILNLLILLLIRILLKLQRGHSVSPLNNPVPLNKQRHLLDATQHWGRICARGEQAHQVRKWHHFDWRPKNTCWQERLSV